MSALSALLPQKSQQRRAARDSTETAGTHIKMEEGTNCPSCTTFHRKIHSTPGATGRIEKLRELSETHFQHSQRLTQPSEPASERPSKPDTIVPDWVEKEVRTLLESEALKNHQGRFKEWFPSLDGLPDPVCHYQLMPELSGYGDRGVAMRQSHFATGTAETDGLVENATSWGATAASTAASAGQTVTSLWQWTKGQATGYVAGDDGEDLELPI
ncbi:hypothetical protein IAT40_004476 [Kwoniella sp. CBS 6097]